MEAEQPKFIGNKIQAFHAKKIGLSTKKYGNSLVLDFSMDQEGALGEIGKMTSCDCCPVKAPKEIATRHGFPTV